jgi:hypothetical protein
MHQPTSTPFEHALVRPACGCPYEEFEYRGMTVSIHADPGNPISAHAYDFDCSHDLRALTMPEARQEACAWIDQLLRQGQPAV